MKWYTIVSMDSHPDGQKYSPDAITTDMVLGMTPTMVIFLDPENCVLKISVSACEYLGIDTPDNAPGKSIFKLITDPVLLLLMKRWTQTLAGGASVEEVFP